jgi:hypothetical protein
MDCRRICRLPSGLQPAFYISMRIPSLLRLLPCLAVLAPIAALADSVLRINEFMAANGKTLRDRDLEYPDWIEIYNEGPDAANLGGWTLTDTPGNLARWTFPATNLAANAYLVVFASGKNRAVAGAELHTSFSLSADGEYLALANAEGEVISEFAPAFPKQFSDVSYGTRLGRLWYFSKPTPNAANEGGYNDFVADTQFDPNRGFCDQPFDLTISTATADAVIVYTTNGSPPSVSTTATNGFVYRGPIPILGTTTVRAAAFRQNFQPSNIDTHTFLFISDIIRQSPTGAAPAAGWPAAGSSSTGQIYNYGMDPDIVDNAAYAGTIRDDLKTLPSFSIVMDLNDLFSSATGIYANAQQDTRTWERKASVELINPDGGPGFQIDCGIRIRGGYSRSGDNPKHAFRFFFREVYGATKLRFPLFGDAGADTFDCMDLRTFQNYSWSYGGDSRGVFMRDQFARDSQLEMSGMGERGNYYHLYLNGQYWGLYNTCERPESSYAETYYGGDKDDYDVIKVSPDNGYTIGATDGNMTAWTSLYNLCRAGLTNDAAYERILGNNPDGTRNPAYARLIDLDNLNEYMLVILHGGNLDAPISNFLGNNSPNNWYGFRNRIGADGFRFVAHDSEHTLLNVNENRTGPYAAGNSSVSSSSPQWVWQRMWTNAEFRVAFADRAHQHLFNGGALTPEACTARFGRRQAELDRAVVAESARWGDSKTSTPLTRANWLAAVNDIRNNFFPQRTQILLNQLIAKQLYPSVVAPTFGQHGGIIPAGFRLTVAAPAGAVYYTLDGSDPRRRGGAVAPTALRYTAALTLNESVRIQSRALSGTNWSALNAATFLVSQSYTNLIITEIMYHPPAAGEIDGDEFEFLELKNLNPFEIDLSGVRFTNGIAFTFPLGQRLAAGRTAVLVRNPTQFSQRYPGVAMAGAYEGSLANSGERLTLVHADGRPLFGVAYSDAPPWPVAPDGEGFSLVLANPVLGGDPDDPARWRASALPGGSPGADDPPVNVAPVVVNEVLTHTDPPQVDTVELFNPSPAEVDIGGWYLTDNRSVPTKFRLPSPTRIPANGFVCFDESQFNPNPDTDPGFAFSSLGEEVFLFSADAQGQLTGYSDGFTFGAAANGVTFGRYTNSVGEVQFPPQSAPTLGTPNAGPAVGPVVINEIHYQPAAGDIEFVEIKNLTDQALPLYDLDRPTNVWRLNGTGFHFPPAVVLPPRGLAVVASTPPDTFRNAYGVPAGALIFGPYPGALQNSGEQLELQRPDTPETDPQGQVTLPYVTVDAVRYNDKAPWPTAAAGFGPSLERVHASAYGDDPANWRASFGPPSPALENDGNRAPIATAGPDQEIQAGAFPLAVALSGSAQDDGLPLPAALRAAWTLLSGPGPVVFTPPDRAATTVLVPGPGTYLLRLSVNDGEVVSRDDLALTVTRPSGTLALLNAGAEWRYLDDGSNQGTNWIAPGSDDRAWKSGRAQFGYSSNPAEGDEVTTLNYGLSASKYVTYYFRTRFTLADAAAVTALTSTLLRDDGAVVYLNGKRAYADNMPTGDPSYQTLASNSVGGADESTWYDWSMDPAALVTGTNVLAVEIHQNSRTSSDVSFDFQLQALAFPANRPPTVSAGSDLDLDFGQTAPLIAAFTDDGLPNPPAVPTFAWTKISGPGNVAFNPQNSWVAQATFTQLGTYVLRLTVDDGSAAVADDLRVTVRRVASLAAPQIVATIVNSPDTPPTLRLTFAAEPGWNYRIESCDGLVTEPWKPLALFPAADAPRPIETPDPITPDRPQRCYRVIAE